MKKITAVLLILCCVFSGISGKDGALAGDKNLQIVKTQYFDIIYPPESSVAASIIAQKGDALYDELAELYKMPYKFRMPVTISHGYEVFNAYFSFAPFNHIVMYDAQPGEDTAVFEETFFNTFKHELTHAVTLNIHNKFWRGFENILGDSWNGGALIDTTFMMEGSAVQTESNKGQGRVNDEYSIQMVKQAKIEGVIPSYTDVQGAISVYPSTTQCYIFGGLFWSWIVQKYGEEKFARFWYKCNNLQTWIYFAAFKRVFGISFKEAWKNFFEELKVPENIVNPAESGEFNVLAGKNYKGNVKNLAVCSKGIAYYDTDGVWFSENLAEGKSEKSSRWKKILSDGNISELSFSKDGRFLAVSYNSYSQTVPKNCVYIYDLVRKTRYYLNETGLKRAGIFSSGGKYFVVAEKAGGKKSDTARNPELNVFEVEMAGRKTVSGKSVKEEKSSEGGAVLQPVEQFAADSGRIKKIRKVWTGPLGFENQIFSLNDGGNGKIYFLLKNGLKYSVCSVEPVLNKESESAAAFNYSTEFDFPDSMHVKNLSVAENSGKTLFLFSFVKPGIMPRLGTASYVEQKAEGKKQIELTLSEKDLSGGVFWPVLYDKEKIGFAGKFYSGNMLFEGTVSAFDLKKSADLEWSGKSAYGENCLPGGGQSGLPGAEKNAVSSMYLTASKSVNTTNGFPSLVNARKFTASDYFYKGTFVPFIPFVPVALSTSKRINNSADGITTSGFPLGISYISGAPWTWPLYGASAAYDYFSNSGIFSMGIYGRTDTGVINYRFNGQVEVDSAGYKQTYENGIINSSICLNRNWYFTFSDNIKFFEGRQNLSGFDKSKSYNNIFDYCGSLEDSYAHHRLFADNVFSAGFTDIHKTGPMAYEKAGISLAANYEIYYFLDLENYDQHRFYQNLGFSVEAAIPRLLPLRDKNRRFTYNFPLTLDAYLFPSSSYFAAFGGQLVLFSAEIQKAATIIPFSLIYFNRISILASYSGKFRNHDIESWAIGNLWDYFSDFSDGNMNYGDNLSLKCQLTLTPDFGGLANNYCAVTLTGSAYYRFNVLPDDSRFGLTFGAGFNF